MSRPQRPTEGYVCTGWHAHKDGVTDVSVGHYDVPECWHVWLKRSDDEAGVMLAKTPYRMVDGERQPEPDMERRYEVAGFAISLAVEGRINILRRQQDEQQSTAPTETCG
jgi:hypothetical protein